MSDVLDQQKPQRVVATSLRDFTQSGYRRVAWEIAEGLGPQMLFQPLEIEILESDISSTDPFFDDFSVAEGKKKSIYRVPVSQEAAAAAAVQAQGPSVAEQLEAKYQEGLKAGIEQGKAAALKESEAAQSAERAKVENFFRNLQTQIQSFFAETEKKALQFSLDVSRELLQATAEAKPEYIFDIIRQGLKAVGSATPIRLRVSATDFEFLNIVGLPRDLTSEELGIEYVADDAIKSGCVIETNYGDVDLQLESMWEQMRENLREVFE